MSPTLDDVARRAGVSAASVSRVVNNTGQVSDALRAQVESAIQQVRYRPKHLAAPDSPLSKPVAIVCNDILNPYFHQIVQGAQEEAEANGMILLAFNTSPELQRQAQSLELVTSIPLAGLVIVPTIFSADELSRFYAEHRIPMVVMHTRVSHPHIASIVVDFENAGCRAAQHLLDLGHVRIAYLAGPVGMEAAQARKHGIETALTARGLTLSAEHCPNCAPTLEGGFQAMSAVLSISVAEPPTAVIAYNDLVAIGALNAIRTHGLRVPDDISIIGFDNIPMAAHTNPPLTTIAAPKYQMGKLAIQNLMQMQRGELAQGGYTLLESTMVVRDSTRPIGPARGLGTLANNPATAVPAPVS